jgi:hypothetical protein
MHGSHAPLRTRLGLSRLDDGHNDQTLRQECISHHIRVVPAVLDHLHFPAATTARDHNRVTNHGCKNTAHT